MTDKSVYCVDCQHLMAIAGKGGFATVLSHCAATAGQQKAVGGRPRVTGLTFTESRNRYGDCELYQRKVAL